MDVNCYKEENHDPTPSDHTMVMDDQPTEDILSLFDVNIVLNILREAEWNWFSFVTNLESILYTQGHTQEILDKLIVFFFRINCIVSV